MSSEEVALQNIFPPFNVDFYPIIPCSVVLYFLSLFVLRLFMKNRPAYCMDKLLATHNFLLCIFSAILSLGQAYEAYRMITEKGLYHLYCGTFDNNYDYRMARWCIAFYLSKYYELLDTVFLILRKKPLTLLHVFHHALVIPISWMAVHSEIYMGWITAYNNATIHVFMYYYFGVYALGQRPYWKKYLTSLQIIQFILDISTSIPFIIIYFLGYPCRGELYAWVIANLAGFSLLVLFMQFFQRTYTTPQGANNTPTRNSNPKKDH